MAAAASAVPAQASDSALRKMRVVSKYVVVAAASPHQHLPSSLSLIIILSPDHHHHHHRAQWKSLKSRYKSLQRRHVADLKRKYSAAGFSEPGAKAAASAQHRPASKAASASATTTAVAHAAAASSADSKPHGPAFTAGVLLRITSAPENTTKSDIKVGSGDVLLGGVLTVPTARRSINSHHPPQSLLERFGQIEYVDYTKGLSEAVVRFSDAAAAAAALSGFRAATQQAGNEWSSAAAVTLQG